MDDKWDIEMTTAELKYIIQYAKFKRGDVVHTWIDNKCVVGTVTNVICVGTSIYYDVYFGTDNKSTVMEELLTKTGHTSLDAVLFAYMPF